MKNPIKIEKSDNIAIVWADNPPVNAISLGVRGGLMGAFEDLKTNPPKAIILACKGRTFFAGADISEFDKPPQPPHLQEVLNLIEDMEVPVIAALFGTALGGGLETALACHYRIATKDARVGLPEIHLGIFPGAGGTQRLPRLIGVPHTLEVIMKGKPLSAARALELGILDRLVEGDLMEKAKAFADEIIRAEKGPRRTSDLKVETKGAGEAFKTYERFVKTRLRGRENPALALKAISAALDKSFAEGLALERKLNLEAKQTLESKALRHIFFAERKTRKIPGLSKNLQPEKIEKIGVLGAGTMGAGIAMCFANAGFPVCLVENSEKALKAGVSRIEKTYAAGVKKGRLSETRAKKLTALVKPGTDFDLLKDCDLVVEAVFEDLDLKKEVFGKLDKKVKKDAILATNTSTLDVNKIASVTRRPDKVLGLHFFSPANIMPLLEVVRAEKVSDQTLITALDIGRKIRKKPVVSGVCFGFIGNRMLSPYGREAQRMLLEGAKVSKIDRALEDFGMAMGVLAVYDLAGIDVGHKVREAMGDQKPDDPTFFKAAEVLYRAGRFGQKTGAGFYKYEKDTKRRLEDPEVPKMLAETAKELGISQRKIPDSEIIERCFFPLVNEAAKILEEGIALRASDIDVVWTSGYGFPKHKGGPMFWADSYGLDKILNGMKKYRERFGAELWTPAALLEELVEKGENFNTWDAKNA